jgi:RNA polymerase sigma-70 factor (ECF subfamily)
MLDWSELVDREGSAVWRTAYRIVGDSADAEECFQEVFLDALRLSRRQNVVHWRAMLQRLATRRAIDILRERRRRSRYALAGHLNRLPAADPLPGDPLERAETGERLRWALASIPERQAEVFCLHVLEGWSYLEIGSHLNVPVATVGVWLHRARTQLRERLASLAPEPRPTALAPAQVIPGKEES